MKKLAIVLLIMGLFSLGCIQQEQPKFDPTKMENWDLNALRDSNTPIICETAYPSASGISKTIWYINGNDLRAQSTSQWPVGFVRQDVIIKNNETYVYAPLLTLWSMMAFPDEPVSFTLNVTDTSCDWVKYPLNVSYLTSTSEAPSVFSCRDAKIDQTFFEPSGKICTLEEYHTFTDPLDYN